MPASGVSRSVWCQSPTQPSLCTALRRQQAAAVSVFVSHWRRVCAIHPLQAKRVAEASPPPPPVTHSLTSTAACPVYFLLKDVPAHTSQSAFILFFIFCNLAFSNTTQSVLLLKSSSKIYLFFFVLEPRSLCDVSPSCETPHSRVSQKVQQQNQFIHLR